MRNLQVVNVLNRLFAVGDIGITVFFGYARITAVRIEARAQVFVRGKIAVRQGNIASFFSFDFHSFSFGYKSRKLQVF